MLRASGSKSSVLIVCEDVTERRRVEEEIKTYHARLEAEVRSRTIELEKKNIELERMNKMFVGRELRMAELKKQIAGLEDRKVEDANEK
jgi:predicted  nucleic acid-binding Zn-ribbon protein